MSQGDQGNDPSLRSLPTPSLPAAVAVVTVWLMHVQLENMRPPFIFYLSLEYMRGNTPLLKFYDVGR